MPPILGQPLLLYISATTVALGTLLVQTNDKDKEHAIYYISCTLVGYKLNYTLIERAFLTLCHSMLNNKTKLIEKIDPLKYLLSKVALTRCITKWVMLLNEVYIEYVDRKEIKGKIIANQLVDAPLQGDHPLII